MFNGMNGVRWSLHRFYFWEVVVENEQVLVIKTELFTKIGRFVGFNPNARPYMDAIYNPDNVQYIDLSLIHI